MSNSRLIQQEHSDLKASIQTLREEKASLEQSISKMQEQKKDVLRILSLEKSKVREEGTELGNSKSNVAEFASKLALKEKELKDRESIIKDKESSLESKTKEIELYYQERKNKLDDSIEKLNNKFNLRQLELDKLEDKIEKTQLQYVLIDKEKRDYQKDLANYSLESAETVEKLNALIKDKHLEITELTEQLHLLKSQIEEQEQTFDSIRFELLKREEEVTQKEANITILKHRFAKQLKEHFPYLNVNI